MAYQCPHTSVLFRLDQKTEYERHLAVLRKERANERKRLAKIAKFDKWHSNSIEKLETIQDIREWILNGALLETMMHMTSPRNWTSKCYKTFKITSIDISNPTYSNSCSNSHSAPRGLRTNWGGKHTFDDGTPIPRGYPGFTGSEIKIHYEGSYPGFCLSGALTKLGICTGSGGGGGSYCRYDYTMWLDDWPAIKRKVELIRNTYDEELVIKKLKGEKLVPFNTHIRGILHE